MQTIPFKQTETVSNEYVLALLVIVSILAVAIILVLKFLRQKGFVVFKDKSASRIKLIETKKISQSSQVIIFMVDEKQFILTESNKNIELKAVSHPKLKNEQDDKVNLEGKR